MGTQKLATNAHPGGTNVVIGVMNRGRNLPYSILDLNMT